MNTWFVYNSLLRALVALRRGRPDVAETYVVQAMTALERDAG